MNLLTGLDKLRRSHFHMLGHCNRQMIIRQRLGLAIQMSDAMLFNLELAVSIRL